MLTGGGGIVGGFVHAEDIPVIVGFAAEHHAATGGVNRRGFDGVVVKAPDDVADGALIVHDHGKMDARVEVKILLVEMIGGLVAAAQFAGGGAKDEIGVEAGGEVIGVGVVKRLRAGVHGLFHFRDYGNFGRTGIGDAEARDAALQVNGDTELLEEVNAEDSIERGAAGFGESAEVNGGKADVAQDVIGQLEFGDGDDAGV